MNRRSNPLISFLVKQFICGAVGAFVLCLGIFYFDIAQFQTLSRSVQNGWLFILLMFASLMVFFGTVAMSVGVMRLGTFSDDATYADERRHNPWFPDDDR